MKKTATLISAVLALLLCAVCFATPLLAQHMEQKREQDREAQFEQALTLYAERDYESAYDIFRDLRGWNPEADAYENVCLARMYLSEGKPERAESVMLSVQSLDWSADLQEAIRSVNQAIAVSMPKPTPTPAPKPVWTPKPSNGRKWYDEDEYDTFDYDDPENFYEDHYDDFIDYYDAEDYWYDHYDD